MADEDDGKEYRWETGYEKTWYNLITFLCYYCYYIQKWYSVKQGSNQRR